MVGDDNKEGKGMRLAWATDTHLDASDWHYGLVEQVVGESADALVLCGDISEGPFLQHRLQLLSGALAPRPIWFVLGNHDYYGSTFWKTRRRVARVCRNTPGLEWLSSSGVVPLTGQTALIGDDGWYDLRLGSYEPEQLKDRLDDFFWNFDLKALDGEPLADRLRLLADRSCARLQRRLRQALQYGYRTIVVATHVPPFKEACWYKGAPCAEDLLPFFGCGAMGEMLVREMEIHPQATLTVLCGHTHAGPCDLLIRPNLRVLVGTADYGWPKVAGVLELQ
jgi:predicted phosphohydrolase